MEFAKMKAVGLSTGSGLTLCGKSTHRLAAARRSPSDAPDDRSQVWPKTGTGHRGLGKEIRPAWPAGINRKSSRFPPGRRLEN